MSPVEPAAIISNGQNARPAKNIKASACYAEAFFVAELRFGSRQPKSIDPIPPNMSFKKLAGNAIISSQSLAILLEESLGLRSLLCENLPRRSHLSHRPEFFGQIGYFKLRRGQYLATGKLGIHRKIDHPGRQQGPLDRIGRTSVFEVGLNRVRESLEQVTVVPWTNIESAGLDSRIIFE